jgi:DNA-binding NtrC family response regulator
MYYAMTVAKPCPLAYTFGRPRPLTNTPSEHMTSPTFPGRILVVDDNEDVLQAARLLLKQHFSSIQTLNGPAGLPALAKARAFDALLLDMNFTPGADDGAEGLAALSQVLAIDDQAVVIPVTAHSDVELAVEAMKRGAADFVTKPWENERPCVRRSICTARGRKRRSCARSIAGWPPPPRLMERGRAAR